MACKEGILSLPGGIACDLSFCIESKIELMGQRKIGPGPSSPCLLPVSGENLMSIVAASPIAAAKGGSFLIEPHTPAEVFTPEDLTHEQRQIAATAAQFAREEIEPAVDPVEAKEPGVM